MPKYLSTNEMRSTDGRTRLKSTLNKKNVKKRNYTKLKNTANFNATKKKK